MKVALFDFCETLANFQTADEYVKYVQTNSPTSHVFIKKLYEFLRKYRIMSVPRRMFPHSSIDKKCIMLQMKGRSHKEMDELAQGYYENKIKPALIPEVLKELQNKQKAGYKIYLISGGYSIYLKYFAKDFAVDGVIATTIEFVDGICTGKFAGPDCMFDNKITYIKKGVPDNHYEEWYAYSDSYTDLPMLEMVGHPIVISKGGKSQKWAENKGFEQIIWNK